MPQQKIVRCKHCNGFEAMYDTEHLLDPKKELCNRCFVKLDEFKDKKLIVQAEFTLDLTKISADEFLDYFDNFLDYTKGVWTYDVELRKHG